MNLDAGRCRPINMKDALKLRDLSRWPYLSGAGEQPFPWDTGGPGPGPLWQGDFHREPPWGLLSLRLCSQKNVQQKWKTKKHYLTCTKRTAPAPNQYHLWPESLPRERPGNSGRRLTGFDVFLVLGANHAFFLLCKISPFATRYEYKSEVRAASSGLE